MSQNSKTTLPQLPPGMDPKKRAVPDLEDCMQILVYNRRKGMFMCDHLVPLPPRLGEHEGYRHCSVKLKPGINLAPEEWITALRENNKAFDKSFEPHTGVLELIGTRENWRKRHPIECVKMIVETSDQEALEVLASDPDETRKPVLEALEDELAHRAEHKRRQEEVRREARRAERARGSHY